MEDIITSAWRIQSPGTFTKPRCATGCCIMPFTACCIRFSTALLLLALIRRAHDDFTTYLLLGITAVFAIQVTVNIGMNLGLLPVTGIGLPLVSYGGSSLLMSLALIGLAESVAVRTSSS